MDVKKTTTYLNEIGLPYLVCESTGIEVSDNQICCQEDVYRICTAMRITELASEVVYMVSLNGNGNIISISEISHGTISNSLLPTREIAQTALLSGAVSVILVHNHPGGSVTPSTHDIEATKKLAEALKVLQIVFNDHVIVTRTAYLSMKQEGYY